MYIGRLNEKASVKYSYSNTNIPFSPETIDEKLVWTWDRVFDSAIDIKYTFENDLYIGAVEAEISGAKKLTILVDGSVITTSSNDELFAVNTTGRELIVRVKADLLDIVISKIEIYGCYDNENPFIYPCPKAIRPGKGSVKIGKIVGEGEDAEFAAEFLRESLDERFLALSKNCTEVKFELCREYEGERYTVDINAGGAVVKAASRIALLWGACRIIELWSDGGLPVMSIDDKPDVPMRGFHMGLPRADRIEFVKKLFRYVLLPLGYNHVILEFNGAMRFDRHPEISERWVEADRLFREGKRPRVTHSDMGADGTLLEKEQVREIIDVLEGYGIEVIPEVQSLSHVQYLTNAYPEISEYSQPDNDSQDARAVDVVNKDASAHNYCPSREDTMRYIYDIIDEIVEVAKPKRYVHIGHDEAYHVGHCPICAKKGGPQVFIDDVKALHSYLANKGLKVMMWSDMLHTTMYYTGEAFARVKSELPKDILLLDFTWYFELDRDIEDDLIPEGYDMMMGNLYSSHYPRYASRIAKSAMIGGQISTWVAVSEKLFAENGKFFDLVRTADMLWNAYSYDEHLNEVHSSLIGNHILPKMRDLLHGKYSTYLKAVNDGAVCVGYFPGSTGRVPDAIKALSLSEPEGYLSVDGKYDRLVFKHTTLNSAPRIAWKPLYKVGFYTVTYEDGERVDIPVEYAGGIMNWNTLYAKPMPQQYYRHQGYLGTWFSDPVYEGHTAEGEPILLLGQVWDNPHPEKKISKINYTATEGDFTVLLSAGILGIKH